MNKTKYLPVVIAVGMAASLALFASPVFAQTSTSGSGNGGWNGAGHPGMRGGAGMMAPGVVGTVSAVNGTTLTVTSKMMGMMMRRPGATSTPAMTSGTVTTYTVNASGATVYKNGATSTISSVATGDMIFAQGTVSGSNVTATVIRDGMGGPMGGRPGSGMGKGFGHGSSSTPVTSPIQGNGEPIVAGSIASVSGTTLTVTNASNVTYTIDASSAKLIKNGTTTMISDLVTGDNVIVQGTVNGTSITASSVIDQGTGNRNGGTPSSTPQRGGGGGFFGAIGSFFKKIFGF